MTMAENKAKRAPFIWKTGEAPKRAPFNVFSDGPYFKDGKMNRDPHTTKG